MCRLWASNKPKRPDWEGRGMSLYTLRLEAELPRLKSARSRCRRKALSDAGEYFALLAELMAWQIENTIVSEGGAADALHLFATVLRSEP